MTNNTGKKCLEDYYVSRRRYILFGLGLPFFTLVVSVVMAIMRLDDLIAFLFSICILLYIPTLIILFMNVLMVRCKCCGERLVSFAKFRMFLRSCPSCGRD